MLTFVAVIVTFLFAIYPKLTECDGETIDMYICYNDVFKNCQSDHKQPKHDNAFGPNYQCAVNGMSYTFQVMNDAGYINANYGDRIYLIGMRDLKTQALNLKVSAGKCSKTIRFDNELQVYNGSLPVFADDCGHRNVDVTVKPVDCEYCCEIDYLESKPKLSGNLFPAKSDGDAIAYVNRYSQISFDCGENKGQVSTCDGGEMSPLIPDKDDCSFKETTTTIFPSSKSPQLYQWIHHVIITWVGLYCFDI